jgi:HKD family nuclease
MFDMLFGLKDIHTVISNKRKIGGAAEADLIQLASGDMYQNPVFTNVEISKGQYISFSFIEENGVNIIANVDQIAVIKGLQHKLICQLNNQYIKQWMIRDTMQYLQKLCEVNAGFVTQTFKKEALKLVQDISVKELKKHNVSLPFPIEDNLVPMNNRMFA